MDHSLHTKLFECFTLEDAAGLRDAVVQVLSTRSHDVVQHPLGFYHIKLLQDANKGSEVRLHFWDRENLGKGSALTPFHDHVWKLTSCVLVGQLVNNIIDVKSDPLGSFTLETVEQDRNAGIDTVRNGGERVSFSIRTNEIVPAGRFYQIVPRQFHYSEMGDVDSAISVVLSEYGVSGNPRTLLPIGYPGHAPSRSPVSEKDVVFDRILHLLKFS